MSSSSRIACISGDVHHYMGETRNGIHGRKEAQYAEAYLEILASFAAKGTIFVTGKCVEQQPRFWEALVGDLLPELGCHTYSAHTDSLFKSLYWFGTRGFPRTPPEGRLLKRAWRFYYGVDVRKAVATFERAGLPSKLWRTHAYRGNRALYQVLKASGFEIVSDRLTVSETYAPQFVEGLIQVNVSVNDDMIFGHFLRGRRAAMLMERDKILGTIHHLAATGKPFVLQLHPVAMKVLDDYQTFRAIVSHLTEGAGYRLVTLSEFVHLTALDKAAV